MAGIACEIVQFSGLMAFFQGGQSACVYACVCIYVCVCVSVCVCVCVCVCE